MRQFMCSNRCNQKTGAGGVRRESKNYIGLYGLQAEELQYNEEQEKRPGQDRDEKVL
jgi:hypothetical protein